MDPSINNQTVHMPAHHSEVIRPSGKKTVSMTGSPSTDSITLNLSSSGEKACPMAAGDLACGSRGCNMLADDEAEVPATEECLLRCTFDCLVLAYV